MALCHATVRAVAGSVASISTSIGMEYHCLMLCIILSLYVFISIAHLNAYGLFFQIGGFKVFLDPVIPCINTD